MAASRRDGDGGGGGVDGVDGGGGEPTLAELLARESAGAAETAPDRFTTAKLKKLQLLIDQSKAFSQIISASLVQQHTATVADGDDDGEDRASKRQKRVETPAKPATDAYVQPQSLVNVTLKQHQLNGMNWLISLYENGLNGILADEMGLGKTVQTISLLCFLLEQGIQGPFLIVAPLSVVSNWTLELSSFAPSLSFLSYVGDKTHRAKLRRKSLRKFNVIVTSYEISLIDFQYLKNISWSYLVVDEGHRLKNANCMLFTKLKALHVSNRILLTGTPLQNNLAELWSLLNFILPDVFHDFATFQSYFNFAEFESLVDEGDSKENDDAFNTIVSMEIRKALVENLHTILKPFILRRLKADVLTLPPKREYIVYSNLSPLQSYLYSQLLQPQINFRKVLLKTFYPQYIEYNFPQLKQYVSEYLNYKDVLESDSSLSPSSIKKQLLEQLDTHYAFVQSQLKSKRISNPLMQLRQLCDSPYHYFFPWNDEIKVTNDMILNTSKLQSLDSIIPKLIKSHKKQKILIFSQFKATLELLQTYFDEHPSLNDKSSVFPLKTCILTGSSSKEERDEAIETFTSNPEYKIFLLSTRAANLGLNLTSATTVILYDSDLNPMVDLQAIARVHRIGQTNPCLVFRLATMATVEEAIWERVVKKRVLEGIVIELGDFTGTEAWKEAAAITGSRKKSSKRENILSSLLNFYSSKSSSNGALNKYNDPALAISRWRSNELTEVELNEMTSHDLDKYESDRNLSEQDMPHIRLLSEDDITGQGALDDVVLA